MEFREIKHVSNKSFREEWNINTLQWQYMVKVLGFKPQGIDYEGECWITCNKEFDKMYLYVLSVEKGSIPQKI